MIWGCHGCVHNVLFQGTQVNDMGVSWLCTQCTDCQTAAEIKKHTSNIQPLGLMSSLIPSGRKRGDKLLLWVANVFRSFLICNLNCKSFSEIILLKGVNLDL